MSMIDLTVRNLKTGRTKIGQIGDPSVFLVAKHLGLLEDLALRPGLPGYDEEASRLRDAVQEMLGITPSE